MRYIVLVLLNIPVIGLAILNLITRYKMHRMRKRRFVRQIGLWAIIFIVLVGSYPVYNLLNGRAALSSGELSFFDIVQTTVIILLVYVANNQRQKLENAERTIRDLHQEVSIRLSNQ